MNAAYKETADNHGIDPADAGSVLLTAGAILDPDILSHGASDAIGITEGQTREEVRTKLQNALERLLSGSSEAEIRLAGQIDPEFANDMEESGNDKDDTATDVLIERAKDRIRETLKWLDIQ